MTSQSVFERLASALPEHERKDLLEKIDRSLSFADADDENIFQKQMTVDERDILIQQDLARLGLLSRFLLWLKALVSGKSTKDLFMSMKIRALKAAINRKSHGLTGFETRDFTPKLAEAVFELYERTLPLAPAYRNLLIRSRETGGAFIRLLEQRYPQTKISLSDVHSAEELEEIYLEKGQEQGVRKAVLSKVDELAEDFDEQIFEDVERSVLPIFYLKDIVLFPFVSFFDLFRVSIAGVGPGQRPAFKGASAMLAVEHLERLYFALYNASKVPSPVDVDEDVARYLLDIESESDEGEGEGEEVREQSVAEGFGIEGLSIPEDIDEEESEASIQFAVREEENVREQALIADVRELYESVRAFDAQMPIVELIRYFLKDPYHRLYIYAPRLKMRDYYLAMVKVRFLAELEELAPALKARVVDRKIGRLFKGQNLSQFLNYREYRSVDYEKMGLPFFSRTRSINLLYNFIRWYYRGYVQEVVKILATVILVQNRVSRSKLLQHATAIEDLEQKIVDFDASLSPDTEEGKAFHRLRSSLSSDTSRQRGFRTLVLQKDAQVNAFIERGQEGFGGLEKVFEEVYVAPSEAVRERLGSRYYLNGRLQPLSSILKDRASYIRNFLDVLLQLLKLEGV